MMLSIGMFVFGLHTLAYQELQRQMAWRHPATSRVNARPALQFLGPDEETITLPGVLLPEIAGDAMNLDLLTSMADQGEAWPVIDGSGRIYGLFVITGLSVTSTVFFPDGAARRIEFTLSLKRVEDNPAEKFGTLEDDTTDWAAEDTEP